MSRKQQSQWDFGELFPPQELRRVLTVSELTGAVRRLLEKEIGEVWVSGEITNLRVQSSGHAYFTLKDANAQLSCVLFRGEVAANRELLQDGQKFLLQGTVTVYEPRGHYQMVVRAIEPQGLGALQLAFEKLKRRLQAEGVFAVGRKRPLPRHLHRIGLVTSPTGAAIRDVLHVIQRRQPGLEIVLVPCRVQGEGAATEIAAAIQLLNEWAADSGNAVDLILVTRGGGSLEDLWAFNEEIVARAIFNSALPVVSAVGHEIDFTIADFVADVRAATPSAAAEIITEGAVAGRHAVAEAARRMRLAARGTIELDRDAVAHCAERLLRVHPRRRIEEQSQRFDELQLAMLRAARQGCRLQRISWVNLAQRLQRMRPRTVLAEHRLHLDERTRRLWQAGRHLLETARHHWSNLDGRLRLLAPAGVLARGFSITRDAETGRIVRSAAETRAGQRLKTELKTGHVTSVVQ